MRNMPTVYVDAVKAETASAFLLEIRGEHYWIPKSQIEDPDSIAAHFVGEIWITTWIAEEKGLF